MRVVLAGGGTAGHIEPALAIAAELERQQLATVSDIHFIGGFRGLEGRIVPARGYQLHQIKIVGFPRKINFQLISYPWQFIKAVLDLRNLFKKVKPTFVMGFGGYVAAPSYAAAKLLRIPIVIHESNARPGVTNQRTAKHAALVIESFARSLP
ncbi:MAG: UDP-N-acetylglucosamine--N-acetylmuramyl-(pentapeptide) pyrophosphoryl-undecaprenol N-acetylglucosamine transferase, partial [Actinobacteria bacterium]|nr:UDP-N-acetylglucosamine--N-acetylmuramyl-(pentapeptide) pyrophosphoryl-undecaprenol N-acetylglucosamine transferase [Actinomycetota bacterium]